MVKALSFLKNLINHIHYLLDKSEFSSHLNKSTKDEMSFGNFYFND